jgi:hypothetical protein
MMFLLKRENLVSFCTLLTLFLLPLDGANAVERIGSSLDKKENNGFGVEAPVADRDVADGVVSGEYPPEQRRELFWSLVFLST